MKTKTIRMQIVKNLGNYETVRLECECELEDGENVQSAFKAAKNDLELSFNEMYKKADKVAESAPKLPNLLLNTPEFDRVCKALNDGKADIALVSKHYTITKETENYLKTNKLWK
jgi:hypothetical protein